MIKPSSSKELTEMSDICDSYWTCTNAMTSVAFRKIRCANSWLLSPFGRRMLRLSHTNSNFTFIEACCWVFLMSFIHIFHCKRLNVGTLKFIHLSVSLRSTLFTTRTRLHSWGEWRRLLGKLAGMFRLRWLWRQVTLWWDRDLVMQSDAVPKHNPKVTYYKLGISSYPSNVQNLFTAPQFFLMWFST